jgi:hypothetical protein
MAGQWLKFDASTPEKPETFAITVALGWTDPDLTVGKLLKVWRWFDEHTVNGNAPSVTLALLDLISGVPGLAKAMCDVCWLRETGTGVELPNFDYHNGKTAKERALAAKRAANFRSGGLAVTDGNDESNGGGVTDALPREEKRREYSKPKSKTKAPAAPTFDPKPDLVAHSVGEQTIVDWLALRAKKRAPVTPTVLLQLQREAESAGMSLDATLALCCVRGWTGFEAAWVLKDSRSGSPGAPPKFNATAHVNRNRGAWP